VSRGSGSGALLMQSVMRCCVARGLWLGERGGHTRRNAHSRQGADDDEDPEELFMGLFPRWTVRASIDPSDPHYLDGDDDGEACEP
jgi:hypothetical protein